LTAFLSSGKSLELNQLRIAVKHNLGRARAKFACLLSSLKTKRSGMVANGDVSLIWMQ
jgi:hypothetical protein